MDLLCKKCNGKVFHVGVYYEDDNVWEELQCIICCTNFYITRGDWAEQLKKAEEILSERAKPNQAKQRPSLSVPEWGLGESY